MYLHTKYGFVEADRWDGAALPLPAHQREVDAVAARALGGVIVVRSRQRRTIASLLEFVATDDVTRKIFKSPADWDYEFRAYLTADDWATVMARIALDLDYRNFKSWTTAKSPKQHKLAHAIWHAAHDHKEI